MGFQGGDKLFHFYGKIAEKLPNFNLGEIDLPSKTHAKFHNEIWILSAICALITRWLHPPPPTSSPSEENTCL